MERAQIIPWAIACVLLLTNVVTLWRLRGRVKDPRVRQIKALIAEFERNGYALLEIRRINPDDVFLRNPEGH